MQFITTSGGDEVAIMDAREALVIEGALSLYVAKHRDSNIAIDALRDVSQLNEAREARMDDAVESAAA
ncbi:hypothetical protein [Streptomyces griseosporeus]